LIIIKGHGKGGAFIQTDYLEQVLEPAIEGILEDFGLVTAELGYIPTFIEDGNPAHGHKSIRNPYALFREKHGIQLLNHPSTSPDLNPIEKCWRAMKQSLYRRKIQPTNEDDMADAMIEEWNKLDQDWINGLIAEQRHWIFEVVARRGWMTAN
jgi:transposase